MGCYSWDCAKCGLIVWRYPELSFWVPPSLWSMWTQAYHVTDYAQYKICKPGMKYLKFLLTFPQAEAVNSFVKAKATGIINTPSTEHQYGVLSRTRDRLYDTHSIVMCSQFQSSAEELQSWDTLSQEKVPWDRGENCGVSTDLRKNLVFPAEGKPPMYYKSLSGMSGTRKGRDDGLM